jgi:hypothetical protein
MKSTALSREEPDASPSDDSADLVWGARNIGSEINRTPAQVYYLFAIGALDGAVTKLSHKILLGSRKGLRNLVGAPQRRKDAAPNA